MMNQKKITLVSNDKVGTVMAGPGIRYFNLAIALAKHFAVTLFVPDSCDLTNSNFKIKVYNSRHSSTSIARQLGSPDYIIAQSLNPFLLRKVKQKKIRYIADLYDPQTIEILEQAKYDTKSQQNNLFDFIYYTQALQIFAADCILCSSEKQKDLYIGMMAGQRVINPNLYRQSPDFQKYIQLVPFGLSTDKPVAKNPDLVSNKFPQIKDADKIIFWGGGIWNWFDPLSAIKAVENISKKRPDVKLVFLGVTHPNPKIDKMKIVEEAVEYCHKRDLLDKFVFFNFGWTPYEERVDYLLRSSIGISTHLDNLETRFSFRTRILDYLWAELPIITTKGDSMADLVEIKNLGRVVDYRDISAIENSILDLLDDKDEVYKIKNNISLVKKEFEWDEIAKVIVKIIETNHFPKRHLSHFQFLKLSFGFYLASLKKKLRYGK